MLRQGDFDTMKHVNTFPFYSSCTSLPHATDAHVGPECLLSGAAARAEARQVAEGKKQKRLGESRRGIGGQTAIGQAADEDFEGGVGHGVSSVLLRALRCTAMVLWYAMGRGASTGGKYSSGGRWGCAPQARG